MIHFEDVLPKSRDLFLADLDKDSIEEVLVLRDLRGRVRLFLKPKPGAEPSVSKVCGRLQPILERELGHFWGKVIEPDTEKGAFADVLRPVRDERQPIKPASEYPKWWIIERHTTKSGWTLRQHEPPWPLVKQAPAIVSFYSHKGGVGRTTALCAVAIHAARKGRKVVAVDLDLEAPALGTLLAGTSPPAVGVTDYLLEKLLAGGSYAPDLDEFTALQTQPELIGEGGETIVCVPAGKVNEHYIEKLARLDYELMAHPVASEREPLSDLLRQLKARYTPNLILLDCRAGLHDLGGLAVQRLSHANVIFGLDSQQSWDGLRCIVRALGSFDRPPPCLLVQAMESPFADAHREEARGRFLNASYEVFCELFYEEDDVPDIASSSEAHFPARLPYVQALAGYQNLSQALEPLLGEHYRAFVERAEALIAKTSLDVEA